MVKQSMDLLELLRKRGMDGDVDLLREALRVLVDGIMDAEVSAQIGAQHGERSPERVTYRNGYRNRTWDTRVGTTELNININGVAHSQAAGRQLLPQPAGTAAAQPAGPAGRHPASLYRRRVHSAGGRSDQGPGLRRHLQQPGVAHLRATGRSGGEFPGSAPGRRSLPYVWLDGLTQKVREGGRIVNVCVVVATGVNADGQREILGMDVGASEDGAFWLAFLRSLTARGLSGVELATSDAHQGLKNAIAAVFAGASWQRCRTHFMANLLTRVPKRAQPGVATMVRTIYQQLSPAEVHGQLDRVVEQLREPFAQGGRAAGGRRAGHSGLHGLPSGPLAEAVVQQPAGTAEPGDKAPESLPPKGDVVGIFPNRLSARRLVGAVLAEQHDEWAEARRYLTIPNAAGNEALPEPNMLEAAA